MEKMCIRHQIKLNYFTVNNDCIWTKPFAKN